MDFGDRTACANVALSVHEKCFGLLNCLDQSTPHREEIVRSGQLTEVILLLSPLSEKGANRRGRPFLFL